MEGEQMTDDQMLQGRSAQETLEQYLTRLIAAHEGIQPSQVTLEYIRNQREKLVYPDTRYDTCSNYGGYRNDGLEVLTRSEVEQLEQEMIHWLEEEVAHEI